ncbi:hypothetical protein [Mucilaginibacter myungsuensis]|uniref:Adhesin domain-containing protein n=1 Tax=Mucilaginibacter myungsuensis TaxID=649104 RepID=A0A929KT01_9SPHI|nr:hypothetical protein [Mucilaginibacter myungsuensis]MBE9660986.1 hypothetical protein [Mucilaginibacter myungsuensis]MDN3601032.1 hypothetical protein [Mucilaginibacter myungsuensis]
MLNMRASTKLFIFIVLATFGSMLAYALLTKNEFNKGNFLFSHTKRSELEMYSVGRLSNFSHVQVNGTMEKHDGSGMLDTKYWRPRVMIVEDTAIQATSAEVPRRIGSGVHLKVDNDTLKVSFDTKDTLDSYNYMSTTFRFALIKIKTPRLLSVNCLNTHVYLYGVYRNKIDLTMSHGISSLNDVRCASVNIISNDYSKVKIDFASRIGRLHYKLCNTDVFVGKGTVGNFNNTGMDNLSSVNIVDTMGTVTQVK